MSTDKPRTVKTPFAGTFSRKTFHPLIADNLNRGELTVTWSDKGGARWLSLGKKRPLSNGG